MNFDLQLWALHINLYLNISKAFVTRANFHEGEILQKKLVWLLAIMPAQMTRMKTMMKNNTLRLRLKLSWRGSGFGKITTFCRCK